MRVPVTHALTFDVEDWYQGFAQRGILGWHAFASPEERNLERILDILAAAGATATFFVLGRYAEANARAVRLIASGGHEVATHGYAHLPVPTLTPKAFEEDLRRSTSVLHSILGSAIRGHRAMNWSIDRSCWWALEVLAEAGLSYDSSVCPTRLLSRHGVAGCPVGPHDITLASGVRIREYPAQVLKVGGWRVPVGGGFYFRALPLALTRLALRQSASSGSPGMVYLHPYDIDPDIPKLGGPWRFRLMRYHGLRGAAGKLRSLVRTTRFQSIWALESRSQQGGANGPSAAQSVPTPAGPL